MPHSGETLKPLTIRLFGRFEVLRGERVLPGFNLREGERLLAFLLLHAPEPVTTLEIARRFWPAEVRPDSAGSGDFPSLRQSLRALRSALGVDAERLQRVQRNMIQVDTAGVSVDLLEFDHLARADASQGGQASQAHLTAQRAIALYRGPLLVGWTDSWVVDARLRRQRTYERLLRRLAVRSHEQSLPGEEERWARLFLNVQPADEEMGQALLRLLLAQGRYDDAQDGFTELHAAVLAAKRTPTAETRLLAEEIQRLRESSFSPRLQPSPAHTVAVSDRGEHAAHAIEPAGGAVPLGSPYYVERTEDALFHTAIQRGDSFVLIKGARQVGKTSLLARGLQQAREAGAKVILTDFQKFNSAQLASPDAFYLALASLIARKLGIPFSASDFQDEDAGPNLRMEQWLLGQVLPHFSEPLVWAIDEADRLFFCPFGSEVFGMFRSWHNERALDPDSEFRRLTLAIAYATEAQLFITDLNQSPFNIGTHLSLSDFTPSQVAELNARYAGSALSPAALRDIEDLVGGHPYLLRHALNEVAQGAQGTAIADILAQADSEQGIFGGHLRRLWTTLQGSHDLLPVLQALTTAQGLPTLTEFYRLRAAGILADSAPREPAFRCRLYADFFARQFVG